MISPVPPASGTDNLMSQAIATARNNRPASSQGTGTAVDSTAANASGAALSSLAGNFNQFLTLLTAQLKHQDPSNPTDSSNFTSQIAQFAGVQQQVQTNSNLSNLLQATQENQLTNGVGLIGKTVTAQSASLPLQNGKADVTYNALQSGPVAIAVTNDKGQVVHTETTNAAAGTNAWTWNGKGNAGNPLPDGHYALAVEGASADGTPVALPTTVSGVVTGMSRTAAGLNAQIGGASIPLSQLSTFSRQS